MNEVEAVILAIINAIGVERIIKLIVAGGDADKAQAILDAEYEAAVQAAKAAEKAKFGA